MSCEASSSSLDKEILERIIHKVPGNPVQSKKDKQGYVNLSEKTKSEIQELIVRQDKLLKNKAFINKLPDKGEKILNYKKQLEDELKKREKSDELSEMLMKLNINGKEALDKLEWTGNCNPGFQLKSGDDSSSGINDFESDEKDTLKIFATHSGTGYNKRINRVLPPEKSLIKSSDVEEIEKDVGKSKEMEGCEESIIEEPYVKNLCEKFDKLNHKTNNKEKFLPHRTINRTVEQVLNKNIEKCKKSSWEVTAATPPPPVYSDVKLLPLEESVKLQIHQAEKLKEVQMKHAAEKLRSMSGRGIGFKVPLDWNKVKFRDPIKHYDSDTGDSDEEDKESFHSCHEDEEDADEKLGGITFYNLIDN